MNYDVRMAAEGAPDRQTARKRPGRWRSGEESRQRILDAARTSFAQHGYDRATVRRIAEAARVDPAMVYYFFQTKSRLFAAAMALPVNPADKVASILEDGLDSFGVQIVRHFLHVWDEEGSFAPMLALMRSATTDEHSAGMFREFVQHEILARVRATIGTPDAHLRAELVGSHLMGIALARYVVRLEPLASTDPDTIAAWVGPSLERYLTGEPLSGDHEHP